MSLQVLVSTMNQTDHSLLDKMNIQSDAIIVNQCNRNEIEELCYKGNRIRYLSFNERGVGLSRNNALMRATADICLFADDDVTYTDNYQQIIIDAFNKYPSAGVIVFNVKCTNPDRVEHLITSNKRLRFYNCLKFGTFRIAIKRDVILSNNIFFSLLFGGGAKYSAGEDNLFITDCMKKGIKVFASTDCIGQVTHTDSTWFKGYTEKYFVDKGVLMYYIFGNLSYLFCIALGLKNRLIYKQSASIKRSISLMFNGINQAKKDK